MVCCAERAWLLHVFLTATLGLLQSQRLCPYDNAVMMARRCLLLTDWALWSGVQAQLNSPWLGGNRDPGLERKISARKLYLEKH